MILPDFPRPLFSAIVPPTTRTGGRFTQGAHKIGQLKVIAMSADREDFSDTSLPTPDLETSYSSPSFAHLYDRMCAHFPREVRAVGSCGATIIKAVQGGHEKTVPAVPEIVFRLVGKSELASSSVDFGDGRVSLSGTAGSFYVAPAGAEARWHSEGEHQLLMLAAPETVVREMLSSEDGADHGDPLRAIYGRDIFETNLSTYMNSIWRESQHTGPGASLMLDGLFSMLLGTLSRHSASAHKPRAKIESPPLDARRIARVTEYIDAHLADDVSIAQLAKIACLSREHFSRCFKAATNMTPHRFVIGRRIELSMQLLADRQNTLADIAYACGFSNQAHYSTQFKAQIGMAPGAYRATIVKR